MNSSTEQLIAFLRKYDGINDKAKLAKLVLDVVKCIESNLDVLLEGIAILES